jgi:hypothetical protein
MVQRVTLNRTPPAAHEVPADAKVVLALRPSRQPERAGRRIGSAP